MKPSRVATALLLAAILLLATGLRYHKLRTFGLAFDEDFTIQTTLDLVRADWNFDAVESPDVDGQGRLMPYVYYLTAASMNRLGITPLGCRLPAFLAGVLSVALLFGLARSVTGARTALLAALFLSLSPTAIKYSQTARYLSLSVLATLALAWGVVVLVRNPGWRRGIAVLLLLFLGVRTNLFLILTLPLAALYLGIAWLRPAAMGWDRRPRWLGWALGTTVVLAVAFVAWAAAFAEGWFEAAGRLTWHSADLRLHRAARFFMGTIMRTGVPVFVLGLLGAVWLARERPREGWTISLLAFGPTAIVLLLSLFAYAPARYTVITIPFCCLLAALAITRIGGHLTRYPRLATAALCLMTALSLAYGSYRYLRDGDGRDAMPRAMAYVAERARAGEVLASTMNTTLPGRLAGLPILPEDQVMLFQEQGNWLRQFPERRVWVLAHSSFDPVYQQVRLVNERCRMLETIPASTRFTFHQVTIYRCEPARAEP